MDIIEMLKEFIRPELLVLIPVLYFIGGDIYHCQPAGRRSGRFHGHCAGRARGGCKRVHRPAYQAVAEMRTTPDPTGPGFLLRR